MVQAIAASHYSTNGERKKGGGGTCSRVIGRYSNLRILFFVVTVMIHLYLLRIESIVYRELRSNNQGTEEDSVVAKALRYGTTASVTTTNDGKSQNENFSPTPRNGFLSRGSLRSPIIASSQRTSDLTFDYLEVEIERVRQVEIQQYSHRQEQREEIQKTSERTFPRTVTLNESMGFVKNAEDENTSLTKTLRTTVLEEVSKRETDVEDDESSVLDFERPFYDDCEQILSPLPPVHPTCNNIHELSLSTPEVDSALLSMKGSWRSVWKVDWDSQNHPEHNKTLLSIPSNGTVEIEQTKKISSASVVLKMLHLHRRFDRQSYNAHSTDVIVMDRLTGSPYVVNAYGFCGQSVVTEFASSTGREYVKRYDIGSRERMRIARDLARGLADVQALQPLPHDKIIANDTKNGMYDDTPSIPVVFAHNDINIANTVMVEGRIKWNDFNIGLFMRKRRNEPKEIVGSSKGRHYHSPNSQSNSNTVSANRDTLFSTSASSFTAFTKDNSKQNWMLCPAPVLYRSDMWRSPEEIRNNSYVQVTQTDIYGIANIFYQTMTRHQPWTYKEPGGVLNKTDIANRKLKGIMPTIPEQYLNTTKRELQTLFAATNMCFFPNPENRPTARRLAYGLGSLYEKLKQKERVTKNTILNYLLPPIQ